MVVDIRIWQEATVLPEKISVASLERMDMQLWSNANRTESRVVDGDN